MFSADHSLPKTRGETEAGIRDLRSFKLYFGLKFN